MAISNSGLWENLHRRRHVAIEAWALAASGCGAIVSLTRALAVELAPIRVNAVSPGVVRTNLWKNMQDVDPEDMYSHGEKVAPL
jgi:NAD(P)-dependent dehydrogenase (short-subunit alcohol dehydrogenase family)